MWSDNGNGVRGDLKAVVKAILLDPELLRGQTVRRVNDANGLSVQVTTKGTEYSRLREPVVRVDFDDSSTSAIQQLGRWLYDAHQYHFQRDQTGSLQECQRFSISICPITTMDMINTQTPSRRLPYAEFYTPEFEILDAATAIALADRMKSWCRAQWAQFGMTNGAGTLRISFDLQRELQMARDNTQLGPAFNDYTVATNNKGRMKDLLEYYDILLCNGSLSEGTKKIIYEGLANVKNTGGSFIDGPNQNAGRVEGMILAILTSPDCAVED